MVFLTKKGKNWFKTLGMAVALSNHEIIVILLEISPKIVKNGGLKSRFLYRLLYVIFDL